jgi:hypothetical protein
MAGMRASLLAGAKRRLAAGHAAHEGTAGCRAVGCAHRGRRRRPGRVCRYPSALRRQLHRPRIGRGERQQSFRKRDRARRRHDHRTGHAHRVGKRCLHQSDLRHLQRHGRSQRQGRIDQARHARSTRLRHGRREQRLILRSGDHRRRHAHLYRCLRNALVHGHVPPTERRTHDLLHRTNQLLKARSGWTNRRRQLRPFVSHRKTKRPRRRDLSSSGGRI